MFQVLGSSKSWDPRSQGSLVEGHFCKLDPRGPEPAVTTSIHALRIDVSRRMRIKPTGWLLLSPGCLVWLRLMCFCLSFCLFGHCQRGKNLMVADRDMLKQ